MLLLLSSQGQCQTPKLCPQVDSLYEKWAFVNCETQEQVLPYVYVYVYDESHTYIENWNKENYRVRDYFWSKFATDSLNIVDSLGTVMFKVSKQKFPLIEKIKFVNDEFFQFLWTDTTQGSYFSENFNMSMFVDKRGNEFKPKNILVISVREITKIGQNYIASFYTLPQKEHKQLLKCILIDKEGNKLSKAYSYISSTINKGIIGVENEPVWFYIRLRKNKRGMPIKIRNTKVGFIDLVGRVVIPMKYNLITFVRASQMNL